MRSAKVRSLETTHNITKWAFYAWQKRHVFFSRQLKGGKHPFSIRMTSSNTSQTDAHAKQITRLSDKKWEEKIQIIRCLTFGWQKAVKAHLKSPKSFKLSHGALAVVTLMLRNIADAFNMEGGDFRNDSVWLIPSHMKYQRGGKRQKLVTKNRISVTKILLCKTEERRQKQPKYHYFFTDFGPFFESKPELFFLFLEYCFCPA